MEGLGITKSYVTPALRTLLEKYDNQWEFIEAEDYRVLVEYYFKQKNEGEKNTSFNGGDGDISNLKCVCCGNEDDPKIGNSGRKKYCSLAPLPTAATRAAHGTRSWSVGSVHPITSSLPDPQASSHHPFPFAAGVFPRFESGNAVDQMKTYHSGGSSCQSAESRGLPLQIGSNSFSDIIMAFHSGVSPCQSAKGRGPPLPIESRNSSDTIMAFHSGVSPCQLAEERGTPLQIGRSNFSDTIMAFHSGESPSQSAKGRGNPVPIGSNSFSDTIVAFSSGGSPCQPAEGRGNPVPIGSSNFSDTIMAFHSGESPSQPAKKRGHPLQIERSSFSDPIVGFASGGSPCQSAEGRGHPLQIGNSNFSDTVMAFHSGVSPCQLAEGRGPPLQIGSSNTSHSIMASHSGVSLSPYQSAEKRGPPIQTGSSNVLNTIMAFHSGVSPCPRTGGEGPSLQNGGASPQVPLGAGQGRAQHDNTDPIVAVAALEKAKGRFPLGVAASSRNLGGVFGSDADLLFPETVLEDHSVQHGKILSPTQFNVEKANSQDAEDCCQEESNSVHCGSHKRPCSLRPDFVATANAEPCLKKRIASMTLDAIEEMLTLARQEEVCIQPVSGSKKDQDQAPLCGADKSMDLCTEPESRQDQMEEPGDTSSKTVREERLRRPFTDENQMDQRESVEEKVCDPTEKEKQNPIDVSQEEREKSLFVDINVKKEPENEKPKESTRNPSGTSCTGDRVDALELDTQKNAQSIVCHDAYPTGHGYLTITDDIIKGIRGADCMDIMSSLNLTQFANLPWGQRPEIDHPDLRAFIEDQKWSPERSREAEACIEAVFRLPKGTSKMPKRIRRYGGSFDPHPDTHFINVTRRGDGSYYKLTDCLDTQWRAIYEFLLPAFICRSKRFALPCYFVYWLLRGDPKDKNYHEAFCYFFMTEIRRLRETNASWQHPTVILPHIWMIMNHQAKDFPTTTSDSKNMPQRANNALMCRTPKLRGRLSRTPKSFAEASSQNLMRRRSERIRSQHPNSEHSGGAA